MAGLAGAIDFVVCTVLEGSEKPVVYYEVRPTAHKAWCLGAGAIDKKLVAKELLRIHGVDVQSTDEADAVCIAMVAERLELIRQQKAEMDERDYALLSDALLKPFGMKKDRKRDRDKLTPEIASQCVSGLLMKH